MAGNYLDSISAAIGYNEKRRKRKSHLDATLIESVRRKNQQKSRVSLTRLIEEMCL
jgi:hypothetical protein